MDSIQGRIQEFEKGVQLSPPLPLEVGPLIQLGGLGSAVSSPVGVGAEPRPQKKFWHIWSPGKASGGKDLGSCAQ